MFRISIFLMVTLLIFSATPVSFAQQGSVQAQAEADANADADSDMSDLSKTMWFMLGGLGSTAGCLLGCVGGCALGARLDPHGGVHSFLIPTPSQASCAAAGAILLGAFPMLLGVDLYPHNATPPPERLLGKSPEYIEVYTQIYKSKVASLRKSLVTKGSIAGNLSFVLAMLLLFTSAY